MSAEADSFWVSLAEKFSGLLVIIMGALFLYFTVTSGAVLGAFTGLFAFLGVVMLALGVFLILVRPSE